MPYYHGTDADLAAGEEMRAYDHEEAVVDDELHLAEELALMTFDLFKPADAISRQEAIYLAERPEDCKALGAWGDNVYEVEPIGAVESHSSGWFDLVFDAVLRHAVEEWERGNGAYSAWINIHPHEWPTPEVEAMCRDYWAGLAPPGEVVYKQEHLCLAAKVVARVLEEPGERLAI